MRYALGERIKQRRTELGITQHDLATRAQIAGGTMSSYESGGKMPPADVAYRLATALGVTVEWLIGEEHSVELNTYGDLIRLLLAVEKHITIRMEYAKAADQYGYHSANLRFVDDKLAEFAERFAKIRGNLQDKVIDEDVYELWLEKELKKLDEESLLTKAQIETYFAQKPKS